jgi:hypothetical protein
MKFKLLVQLSCQQNARIFVETDFQTYVCWTLSARIEAKNTLVIYGRPVVRNSLLTEYCVNNYVIVKITP